VLGFTKDIHLTYIDAPERLQKLLITFFFEGFDVVDGIIIKERYRPLFQELIRMNAITINNTKQEKGFENKEKEEVIISSKLGAYSVMLRI
jgi:hypothetical protein